VIPLVLGQGGSFASSTCNLGGVGASSLCFADGLTLDAAGNLYVADFSNNRVLEFDDPLNTDTVADLVFGQGGSFASDLCNSGGRSADSMCGPSSLGVDGAGNLYVPDLGNNRVLEFDDPLNTDTVADLVLGQSGSFATSHCNLGGVNASSLCGPEGVAVDGAGDLYVADEDNNRVLEYNDPLNTDSVADRVFGQGGFNTGGGGTGASRLHQPFGVTVDDSGNLYILDTGNSRVLEYDDPHASAPPTATSNALGGLVKLVVPSASRDTNEGTIWAFGAAGLLLIVAGGAYAWRRVRRE
jgi:sugar lactone lactonase YvrE